MESLLAVIGIVGGFLCAVADCLLDIKGTDNRKLGKMKIMDSKWSDMAHFRFVWSDIIAMFAVPMYTCGFIALMIQLGKTDKAFATGLTIIFLCGAMGGFMIHTFMCLMPTVYQKIMDKADFTLAENVISSLFRQIYVPFCTLYSMLVIIPAIAVMVLIVNGTLGLPLWCVIMNPVVFHVIGLLLRATKCKLFIDAPGICAASLGLGMYGVLTLMLI